MNFFQKLLHQLFGGGNGESDYRAAVNAGKAVAPVAAPLVQSYLAGKGWPVTPAAALSALAEKSASRAQIAPETAAALHDFVAGQLIPL